jgi:hypothetical protein
LNQKENDTVRMWELITPVEQSTPEMQRLPMNSYISLILEAEGAKERLRRLFQSAHEPEKPGCARLDLSEESALIVERSSEEVLPVDRHAEFDASARARQGPTCVAAFIASLGHFLVHLYP